MQQRTDVKLCVKLVFPNHPHWQVITAQTFFLRNVGQFPPDYTDQHLRGHDLNIHRRENLKPRLEVPAYGGQLSTDHGLWSKHVALGGSCSIKSALKKSGELVPLMSCLCRDKNGACGMLQVDQTWQLEQTALFHRGTPFELPVNYAPVTITSHFKPYLLPHSPSSPSPQ